MLVLLQTADGCVRQRSTSSAHRLAACLLADRLTRALAAGRSPDSGALLALHAQGLLHPRHRRRAAQSLLEVLQAASAPRTDSRPVPPPFGRDAVLQARPQLLALHARVLATDAVSVRGMGLLRLLLTDGAGPLHYPSCVDEVRAASTRVRVALDSFPASS
jgi:hypothetical protein